MVDTNLNIWVPTASTLVCLHSPINKCPEVDADSPSVALDIRDSEIARTFHCQNDYFVCFGALWSEITEVPRV